MKEMFDRSAGVLDTSAGPLRWLVQSCDASSPSADTSWLSVEEINFRQTLKTDKRRRDWTLGRRASKRLLAELILDHTGRALAHEQIVILPHADGWPMVTTPAPGRNSPAITLSISHSHGRAFCAAIEGRDQSLGVDIELVEPRSAAFIGEYFTSLEQRYLTVAPDEQTDALVNAVWSGKEAALKAIRRGLAEDTRIVSCLPHPTMAIGAERNRSDSGWLPMRIIWNEDRTSRPMPALSGRWRMMDSFVLTLVHAP